MTGVRVKIIGIVDTSYPMFVEFQLTDINGTNHRFIDKIPVVCECDKYNNNPPCFNVSCTGIMRCSCVKKPDKSILIDTRFPDDIKSLNNEYSFEVWKEQVDFTIN